MRKLFERWFGWRYVWIKRTDPPKDHAICKLKIDPWGTATVNYDNDRIELNFDGAAYSRNYGTFRYIWKLYTPLEQLMPNNKIRDWFEEHLRRQRKP